MKEIFKKIIIIYRKVTCFQIVNHGRVFSGSLDCKVKLFSEEAEVLRQFPSNPNDCKLEIFFLFFHL